ncbi:archease [Candidatus Woesearchaeota archaeon]|nr:archease [Candidatus Woesearchaeota archaeon]MBT4114028.1 archease [Candidatus Woesearchaeota archaeon]MBT4248115.1 archease [Candidatus Woesearchaeota archaeon]
MAYKYIEGITSDVMFEAEGKDLDSMLEQASLALFDVVCQRKKVNPTKKIKIKVEGSDEKDIVYMWLSALLSESDANELFFSKFEVKVNKKGKKFVAKGVAHGEDYSSEKSGTVVKGVTYYNFKVEKTKKGFKCRVVVDI